MLDNDYVLLNMMGAKVLLNRIDVHSVENRFSVLSHEKVFSHVRFAAGYVMVEKHIAVVYQFNQDMLLTQQCVKNRQYVLILKYGPGFFGLLCTELLLLNKQVDLYDIADSMGADSSPFTQYGKVDNEIHPVITSASIIHYLDLINENGETVHNKSVA